MLRKRLGRGKRAADDGMVAGAAADVAFERRADVRLVGGRVFAQQRGQRDGEAGRAVAALEGVLRHQCSADESRPPGSASRPSGVMMSRPSSCHAMSRQALTARSTEQHRAGCRNGRCRTPSWRRSGRNRRAAGRSGAARRLQPARAASPLRLNVTIIVSAPHAASLQGRRAIVRGRTGMRSGQMPIASATALAIAGVTAPMPSSPAPRGPNGSPWSSSSSAKVTRLFAARRRCPAACRCRDWRQGYAAVAHRRVLGEGEAKRPGRRRPRSGRDRRRRSSIGTGRGMLMEVEHAHLAGDAADGHARQRRAEGEDQAGIAVEIVRLRKFEAGRRRTAGLVRQSSASASSAKLIEQFAAVGMALDDAARRHRERAGIAAEAAFRPRPADRAAKDGAVLGRDPPRPRRCRGEAVVEPDSGVAAVSPVTGRTSSRPQPSAPATAAFDGGEQALAHLVQAIERLDRAIGREPQHAAAGSGGSVPSPLP